MKQNQDEEDYLNNDTKYLIRRNGTYYLCIRIGKKIHRTTLRTKDIQKANKLKRIVIKHLKTLKDKYDM